MPKTLQISGGKMWNKSLTVNLMFWSDILIFWLRISKLVNFRAKQWGEE